MLRKKEAYTVVTPIPGFIPRKLALDILHSHSEVITLNPLVLDHKAIPAPRDAAADEYYSTWYEITERVQFLPGAGKLGASKVTFRGCFHDMPWGLQTHMYIPFGIDLRNRYRIAGNQPGVEAPEHRELGLEALGAPQDGLYLREDIEIRGNISLVGFVKAQLKAASKEMVQRIIRKAELLDAGVLQAMMSADGRLQTINPNDRSNPSTLGFAGASSSRPQSYQNPNASPSHPQYARPGTSSSHGNPTSPGLYHQVFNQQQPMKPFPIPPEEQQPTSPLPMELPGDFQYQPQMQRHSQAAPGLRADYIGYEPGHWSPPDASAASSEPHWSQAQPSPAASDGLHRSSMGSAPEGQPSHGYGHQGFPVELATHRETGR